ncbi:hypothetical protein J6590_004626 [Homalodisca vitripennis]|nr:hypothetical protein J6590_004626 [Homalodisca vitripennis]
MESTTRCNHDYAIIIGKLVTNMELKVFNPYYFYPVFIIGILLDIYIVVKFIVKCFDHHREHTDYRCLVPKPHAPKTSSETVMPRSSSISDITTSQDDPESSVDELENLSTRSSETARLQRAPSSRTPSSDVTSLSSLRSLMESVSRRQTTWNMNELERAPFIRQSKTADSPSASVEAACSDSYIIEMPE